MMQKHHAVTVPFLALFLTACTSKLDETRCVTYTPDMADVAVPSQHLSTTGYKDLNSRYTALNTLEFRSIYQLAPSRLLVGMEPKKSLPSASIGYAFNIDPIECKNSTRAECRSDYDWSNVSSDRLLASPAVYSEEFREFSKLSLVDIQFELDSHQLTPQSLVDLSKLGKRLAKYPNIKLVVTGKADKTGTAEYNDALSKKRAQSVAEFLAYSGASYDQFIVRWVGSSTSSVGPKYRVVNFDYYR